MTLIVSIEKRPIELRTKATSISHIVQSVLCKSRYNVAKKRPTFCNGQLSRGLDARGPGSVGEQKSSNVKLIALNNAAII